MFLLFTVEEAEVNKQEQALPDKLDNCDNIASLQLFACESPCHPDVKIIVKQSIISKKGNRSLSFQAGWFTRFSWLHYCNTVQGVLCFYCAKAEAYKLSDLATKRETAFTIDGYCNWKKAIEKFTEHQSSRSHKFAVQQLVKPSKPVDQQLIFHALTSQQQATRCLSVIFTSVKYLARQGQALRGHDEHDGNFMQLLRLRAADITELTLWLERKVDMTSHNIQNEIIQLYGQSVVRHICKKIQQAGTFAIIADGTQDVSRKEQTSICIRYVDNDLCPREEFLGLYEPPDTTGEVLAKCIMDVLLRLQLPLSALRGQTYDGASNMSGKYKGCQAVIQKEQPLALYVHCGAHCANLVAQSVGDSVVPVRDAMQSLQELGSLFSQSLKCRSAFAKIAESDHSIGNFKQIRPLCPTRWLVRVAAIQDVMTQYALVLECLNEMSVPDGSSNVAARASDLYSQLCKGSLLLALKMALQVFSLLEILNKSLQARYQTVSGMLAAVEETLSALRDLRADELFDELLANTAEMITQLDLEELQVRRCFTSYAVGQVVCTLMNTMHTYYEYYIFENHENVYTCTY
jgi:hypothetical protein